MKHIGPASRTDGDRGAYAVMYAVLSIALVGVVSVVVDLAALRLDRRIDRSAADAAAIAGAGQLGELGGSPQSACERAMDYIAANLNASREGGGCGVFPEVSECNEDTGLPSIPLSASWGEEEIGGRTVRIWWPVVNSNTLLTQPDVEAATSIGIAQPAQESDGLPCQRLGVEIFHERDFIFAGIFGLEGTATRSRSVGLALQHSAGDTPVPAVTLGDDCPALRLINGIVNISDNPDEGILGEIAIDASCDPGVEVVPAGIHITTSRVGSFGPHATPYDGVAAVDWLTRAWQVTDRPWMDRYNCPEPWSPTLCGKPTSIETPLNYVDQWVNYATNLSTALPPLPPTQEPSMPPPPTDSTWTVFTEDLLGSCISAPPPYLPPTLPYVNVYVDCDNFDSAELEGPTGTASVSGDLVTNDDLTGDLTVSGELAVGGNLDVGGDLNVQGDIEVSNSVVVRRDLTVSGNATFDADVHIIDDLAVSGSATTVTVGSTLITRDNLQVSGGSLIVLDALYAGRNLQAQGTARVDAWSVAVVRRDLLVSQFADVTIRGQIRVRDDVDVEDSGTIRSPGPFVVRNQFGDGGATGLRIRDSGCVLVWSPLDVNSTCTDPPSAGGNTAGLYVTGSLTTTGNASLIANQALTYVAGGINAGSAALLRLVAPTDDGDCIPAHGAFAAPTPRCFEDLALWTDGDGSHTLRISGDDAIEGTIITPYGDLTVTWSGDLQLNHTQLVAQRLIFNGNGTLTLVPDPERTTLIPQSAGTLIR